MIYTIDYTLFFCRVCTTITFVVLRLVQLHSEYRMSVVHAGTQRKPLINETQTLMRFNSKFWNSIAGNKVLKVRMRTMQNRKNTESYLTRK